MKNCHLSYRDSQRGKDCGVLKFKVTWLGWSIQARDSMVDFNKLLATSIASVSDDVEQSYGSLNTSERWPPPLPN